MASSDPAKLIRIPHRDWTRAVPEIVPDSSRQDESNWEEVERWGRQMLADGWPGSGGIHFQASTNGFGASGGSLSTAGGTLGPVAIGATANTGLLVNMATESASAGVNNSNTVGIFQVQLSIEPTTGAGGLICTVDICSFTTAPALSANLMSFPFTVATAALGDKYPLAVTCMVPALDADPPGTAVAAPGVGIRLTVAGGSANAAQVVYNYRTFV